MSSRFRGDDDLDTTPISTSTIIGISQDWRNDTARTAATWYHNNSNKAIQIYGYHTTSLTIRIGPSTTNYVTHRVVNRDSTILDCPVQPIVPAGHYWYVSHVDHTGSSEYQNILD